ncbi:hypothetical protein LMH87_004952 [Akanthomyces muscarius]|uniref:Uncharacterized protein n=1 Tax=Akanthomyces muscarius TaxID=2231603 RepID=A0A9W8URM5_AKAMU|nr:hypothetical protein LMH87_004952 [Akanthomyces muscarius]KAJ4163209.1 hypothetical protein LMH87_004952 [Akanthomyces muscarius]
MGANRGVVRNTNNSHEGGGHYSLAFEERQRGSEGPNCNKLLTNLLNAGLKFLCSVPILAKIAGARPQEW